MSKRLIERPGPAVPIKDPAPKQPAGKAISERPGPVGHGPLSGTTGKGPQKPPTPGK